LLADSAHGNLHGSFELAEPIFDVALALDVVVQSNGLGAATPVLVDRDKKSSIDSIKGDAGDGIEHFLEIILDLVGISSDGKDLEQVGVGAEVETGEDASLLLEVSLELPLAVLEIFLHLGKSCGKQIILAARDDEFLLGDSLHDLLPLRVGVLEDLGLLGHLLGDFTTGEYEDETHPGGLDLEPLLEGLLNLCESVELGLHLSSEWSNRAGGKHLNESHHVFFECLLMLGHGTADNAREVVVLVGVDLELGSLPVGIDILTKLLLLLLLFQGGVTDVFDVLLH
jgi:hypothetical protein